MSDVLAVDKICLPRPLFDAAPSIIPGKSNNCIIAPLWESVPAIQSTVVNSCSATLLKVFVTRLKNVDLPTDGNPIKHARPSPDLDISHPLPLTAAPFGRSNSAFNLASLAFNIPR
ncbi:hypothetical protein HERIO_2169 [Hepatospora eriocheir]|uniref:Uncharacterized protein n=1 Tax=Hepatospora eriocheir TaxID=1081669 RepID=A0A1X0Q7V8_9MICR|nr:hypothetical protein HERIO_2169 [Hepatospora eriocheir]